MPRKLGVFVSLLAVFVMFDGNWAVLQTIAWAKMIESDLRALPASEPSKMPARIVETLSGQRPCSMCLAIIEERSSGNEGEQGADSRGSLIQLAPIAFSRLTLRPPVPGRTAVGDWEDVLSSAIRPAIDPPPRPGSGRFIS